MNTLEKQIDGIDCDLFRLGEKAHRLTKEFPKDEKIFELSKAIDAARGKSFYMLPEKRRKEFD